MHNRRRNLAQPWNKMPEEMNYKESIAARNSIEGLRQLEHDLTDYLNRAETIPRDWFHICFEGEDRDAKRERITISLDADVVKFFKALGPGYQPKMNRVLRSFMQARVAKILDGE